MALPRDRRILLAPILLAAVCLVAAAGCGGGDDAETESTSTDEYIVQADAICSESDAENSAAFRQAFGNEQPTKEEAAAYVGDVLVPALELQLEEVRALSPPEGDAETVNAIWDQVGEVVETMKEDPEAALGVEDPFSEVTPQAEAYGFKSCGVSSGAAAGDDTGTGTTGTTGTETTTTG